MQLIHKHACGRQLELATAQGVRWMIVTIVSTVPTHIILYEQVVQHNIRGDPL